MDNTNSSHIENGDTSIKGFSILREIINSNGKESTLFDTTFFYLDLLFTNQYMILGFCKQVRSEQGPRYQGLISESRKVSHNFYCNGSLTIIGCVCSNNIYSIS